MMHQDVLIPSLVPTHIASVPLLGFPMLDRVSYERRLNFPELRVQLAFIYSCIALLISSGYPVGAPFAGSTLGKIDAIQRTWRKQAIYGILRIDSGLPLREPCSSRLCRFYRRASLASSLGAKLVWRSAP
ncbi:hypothetical protein BD779DRAFT_286254 [Infundibulicybe gibba]|nr:hypothetical protein BD779DRAFT_286254 [Infundibulicybe gibba]